MRTNPTNPTATPGRDVEADEIARLVAIRDASATGTIGRDEYEKSLEAISGDAITPGRIGALRRKVSKVKPAPERPTESLDFSDPVLVLMAACATLRDFWAYFVAINHADVPYSTFYGQFRSRVDHRLAALVQPGRGSMQHFRDAIVSCLWSCRWFGQAWQTDVCTLPFKVRLPGYRYPVRVKLIAIIDDATRLIVAWNLVVATPGRDVRASDVCGVLIDAMNRYGIPQQIVMDNGREFDNTAVNALLRALVVTPRFTPRYRGERKGKIERFFGTLVRWMVLCFPSWTAGKNSSARYTLLGGDNTHAPDLDTVNRYIHDLIDVRYNTERVHRALRTTPADAKAADPTELRELNLVDVLKYAPIHNQGTKIEFVKVQSYGINFDNEIFINVDMDSPGQRGRSGCESLERMRGDKHGVRLRPVPGDPSRVGVYDVDDRFVCIATEFSKIPAEVRFAHSSDNDRVLHLGEQILAKTHTELAGQHEATDDEIDDAVRDVILGDALAEIAGTSPTQVLRTQLDPYLNGQHTIIDGFYIDDNEITLDDHDAADLLMTWADAEHTDIYRIDTPTQSLTWDQTRPSAQLANKNTSDITYIRLVNTVIRNTADMQR